MVSKVMIVIILVIIAIVALFLIRPTAFQSLLPIGQDISDLMHQIIDPISPTFIHDAEVACTEIGGQWNDQFNIVGCFNMPPNTFDANNCLQMPYTSLQSACNGITNAQWTCNSENVGCFY